MRRDDIEPGGVYAFHEGRPRSLLDASFTPWLVLDNHYYTRDDAGRITLASAGARPHAGRYRHQPYSVGLPAIALATTRDDDPGYKLAPVIAELRERLHPLLTAFHDQQLVTRWGGQTIGRYYLVTSLAHLHGEYAEVMGGAYTALVWRFAALGIGIDEEYNLLDPPSKISLSFEHARQLLDIAEGQAAACAGYEPAPGSPELT